MLTKLLQIGIYTVIPLVGILFLDWDWRQVLILYWLENIAIGIATIIRIASAPSDTQIADRVGPPGGRFEMNGRQINITGPVGRAALAGFFAFHYGIFTLIHGIFVFSLASGAFSFGDQAGSTPGSLPPLTTLILIWLGMTLAQLGSIWRDRQTSAAANPSLTAMFTSPYKRIIALHFAIVFGASIITILDLPPATAIILIVMHAITDAASFHQAPHRQQ